MAIELFSNPPTPGGSAPWIVANLSQAITTAPTPGTVENWGVSTSAPAALRSSQTAQFRVIIDSEILIVTASSTGTSPWTFTRGAEGTTPVPHNSGAPIYHVLTAGALNNIAATGPPPGVLLATNNLSDVGSVATARTNLGLGTLATQSTLTTSEIAAAWPTVVETPEKHGAVRDGITDDTAAIKAAINAAYAAGVANGTNYAEVWFSAGVYAVLGSVDTSQQGRAQLPLPWRDPSAGTEKFVLVLKGVSDGSAVAHWQQTTPQKAGAVLLTNLNAVYSGTLGSAAVIGGPTPEVVAGATTFSNLLVVIDGLTIQCNYSDPVHTAVDLQRVAQTHIKSLGVYGNVAPGTSEPNPSSGGGAVRMPQVGNNDNCVVDTLSIEGYTSGFVPGEHTVVTRLLTVYCHEGIAMFGVTPDSIWIGYWSSEANVNHLSTRSASSVGNQQCNIDIGIMDVEDGAVGNTVWHIDDPNNVLRGTIQFRRNKNAGPGPDPGVPNGPDAPPVVNGAGGLRIINAAQVPGGVTAPSVPATTVAFKNPFWRDAMVTVAGTGLTGVTIDGQTMALVPGTYPVPSGRAITLTYTGTPSWNWILL